MDNPNEAQGKEPEVKHMIATTATHLMGDLSRKHADLCIITSDDGENWIGYWATGFRFMDVKFPKATTRELTDEEKEKYRSFGISINSQQPIDIKIK